jgi:rare lipoprotein A
LTNDSQAATSSGPANHQTIDDARTTTQTGQASGYGEELRGRRTANGEIFDPVQFTAASWYYPFNTRLRVSHDYLSRGRRVRRSVVVRVNDRGPNRRFKARVIDLSEASFAALADTKLGLIPVTIEVVK